MWLERSGQRNRNVCHAKQNIEEDTCTEDKNLITWL